MLDRMPQAKKSDNSRLCQSTVAGDDGESKADRDQWESLSRY